jgi:hypothetical protein
MDGIVAGTDYDHTYIIDLCNQLEEPTADVTTLLFQAVREDGTQNPLPFELVQAVLDEMQLRRLDSSRIMQFSVQHYLLLSGKKMNAPNCFIGSLFYSSSKYPQIGKHSLPGV